MTTLTILLAIALAALILALPRVGILAAVRRFRAYRARERSEDALKHLLAWQHCSKTASLESIAGALRLSPNAALRLTNRLQASGWIRSGASGIALTPRGERRALAVVRAHRLWERHLSDDANMPIARLHHAAEHAEHTLTTEQVEQLDAHLGHPQHDPHGDPIPSADGRVAPLNALSLTDWPVDTPCRIAHIEDEPEAVFRRILAAGLRPAQIVRIRTTGPDGMTIESEGTEHHLDAAVAANVQVTRVADSDLPPADALRLSDLPRGAGGEVIELGPGCQGFSRRRLLDLGLTPGAKVEVALETAFGDPRGFRIRGTTIALRNQQARQVWIRPLTLDLEPQR